MSKIKMNVFGLLLPIFLALWPSHIVAHFIQIDHNEFRTSGFPRPHLPPPPTLPPLEQVSAKELTPAELMVDLTNDLTYRLLHYHSILNRNNFAFSPTALMSVLVALYEGSGGRSATELRNVLQLPNNRDVIRVGYRDIHRRLRTYFFGSDNPLKGLSLNRNNVTILSDYETILMFYGYDLGMDMISSSVVEPTTVLPTAENITIITNETVQEMQAELTTVTSNDTTTTTEETTEAATSTTTVADTTTETTTEESTSVETAATESTEEQAETAPEGGENEAAELVSAFVAEADAEPLLRIQKARVSRLPTSRLQAPLKQSYITPKPNYLPSARSMSAPLMSTIKPTKTTAAPTTTANTRKSGRRIRRHIPGYKELDSSLFLSIFNPHNVPQPPHPAHAIYPTVAGATFAHLTNEFDLDVMEPHFLDQDHTSNKQNYNADVISHVFYLGYGHQQQIVHTTFKVYNAVLYFKYFEHLKMSVLELELDTPEYNLIIMLPDYHSDIVAAAASLKLGPTLRLMRKQLKPRWVQAIIPDFKLHGTMFLTNDLQNLGVCDVFEPNRAVFKAMTDEKGVYVRHIEQSINVNIRTHPINQLKRNYGAQTKPIQISVNHPFLFFIIDRELDVAVMAGRILNPLNVRIQ